MQALPLTGRSQAAIFFLGLTMAGSALSLWADSQQTDLLNRIVAGERVPLSQAEASDDRVAWTAVVFGVGFGLAAITFLLWYSRAYRNVIALGMYPRFGTRWAVGYWFIPFVNLVRPKQVMNDIWRGSHPDMPSGLGEHERQQRQVSPLLHWWWGIWLVSNWIGQVVLRTSLDDGDFATNPEGLRDQSQAYMFVDVMDLVAGALAILIVLKITRRAEERRLGSRPDGERQGESVFGVPEPPVYPQA